MYAGQLNRRITIQRRSAGLDAYGQPSLGWTEIAEVWANIKPIGGREKLRAMAFESTLTHTVLVRYQASLVPEVEADGWQILYGSRIFNISSAMDYEDQRRYIVFDCIETGADA